jgi:hypothetical protein
MSSLLKSKPILIFALILSLPILLPLYNPSLNLGSIGILLGFIGMTISPIILFGVLILSIKNSGK